MAVFASALTKNNRIKLPNILLLREIEGEKERRKEGGYIYERLAQRWKDKASSCNAACDPRAYVKGAG